MVNGTPRILAIRLSAIGDVVRVLPALETLRCQYPKARIDFLVEPKSADVVQGHPFIDTCLLFERPKSGLMAGLMAFRDINRIIRHNQYDIVLDFHGLFKSGLLTWLSGARQREGFARPRAQEFSWLFTNHHTVLPSATMNRVEENLALVYDLGVGEKTPALFYPVPDEIHDEIDRYVEAVLTSGKHLALVHAPVERPEKQWPLESFSKVVDMLLADGRFEVVLSWGPGQQEIVRQVQANSFRPGLMAPATATLKHFIALAQRADVFVGCDSGPMHLAALAGTPVVAVFGGTDPARHAPILGPHTVLYTGPTPYTPPRTLRDAQDRLAAVTPREVYDACIGLLYPSQRDFPKPPARVEYDDEEPETEEE